MPIAKGEAWGHTGPVPAGAFSARDDADLATLVASALGRDEHISAFVGAGDLLRTVGGVGTGPSGGAADRVVQHLPVDLGFVSLDGNDPVPFVAHVIARRRWWVGEAAAVMNAAWLHDWYLGPKSHPNDGLLDVTVGSLPPRQRLEARRRAPSGTHLPHPALRHLRVPRWEHGFGRPTPIKVDGQAIGTARAVEAWLVSDAFTLLL